MHSEVWSEMIYPSPSWTVATAEIWVWISNFIHTVLYGCNYLSILGWTLFHINKRLWSNYTITPHIIGCFLSILGALDKTAHSVRSGVGNLFHPFSHCQGSPRAIQPHLGIKKRLETFIQWIFMGIQYNSTMSVYQLRIQMSVQSITSGDLY